MGALLQNTVFGRNKNSFVSTWRTSNTSTGSSTATQIKLPLVSSGTYNFTVDWGDGSSNTITAWNQAQVTHTYLVAGDYVIKINGTCRGWQFNNTGDRLKLLSIERWGTNFRLGTNQGGYFYGCSNLNLSNVSDILNLSGTTSFGAIFTNCTSLTIVNKINEWDTSSVINMYSAFLGASSFNQNISSWNVSAVTTFASMFSGAKAFDNGGSADINNWSINTVSNVLMNSMFAVSAFNQPIGNWNVSHVISMSLMFNNANIFNQDVGAWDVSKVTDFSNMFAFAKSFNNGESPDINNWQINTTAAVNTARMFLGASSFNQNIGSWNVSNVNNFSGMFQEALTFNNAANATIGNWNTSMATNMSSMFENADAFNQNIGSWNVSNVTTFQQMFRGADSFNNGGSTDINNWILKTTGVNTALMFQFAIAFNQPIGNWNTIGVINMSSMFYGASKFNQNIGAWNVSNVTNMAQMFFSASIFNNGGSTDINNWTINSSAPVDMSSMFYNAFAFNQPIGSWNTSTVNSMLEMFRGANAFNQNIGSWNTGNVTTMQNMFQNASAFNQPIGSWNTTNVRTMFQMFYNAQSFDQNIGSWNVSNVTNFENMFLSAKAFNNGGSSDINNWSINTTGSVSMSGMFQSTPLFNQNIGSWNTSNVVNMNSMFYIAPAFNQNISSWNTSNVTTMWNMFFAANAFNQNISSWNVSNVTNFAGFMGNKLPSTFSSSNLDAIYNGWSTRSLKPSLTISFGTAKYTSASSLGRAIIVRSPNNWVIGDGGI